MPDLWPGDYLLSVGKQVQVGGPFVVCAQGGQRHVCLVARQRRVGGSGHVQCLLPRGDAWGILAATVLEGRELCNLSSAVGGSDIPGQQLKLLAKAIATRLKSQPYVGCVVLLRLAERHSTRKIRVGGCQRSTDSLMLCNMYQTMLIQSVEYCITYVAL